jgi:hypothetical protein
MVHVGVALDRRLDRAKAFGGTVPARAVRSRAIDFDELREIDLATESGVDCIDI